MAHANARTNVFARKLMIERVAAGWPAAHVAEQLGVSRATVYKWLRRFDEAGEAGLADRSCRPLRSPHRLHPSSRRRCWLPADAASAARSCWLLTLA